MKENMTGFFLEQIDKVNNNGYTYIEIQDPEFFKDLVNLDSFEQLGFEVNITTDKIRIDWSNWENAN